MKAPSLIFLIGMPCAGKTWWGTTWASESGWHFTDLDALVEARDGRSIADIFAAAGEPAFRTAERRALYYTIHSASPDTIVACGGGTPAFQDNLGMMKTAGLVIYLKADVDTLVSRARQSEAQRPLLSGADLHTRLVQLLSARIAYYEQADVIIEIDEISTNTFAQILKSCTDPH